MEVVSALPDQPLAKKHLFSLNDTDVFKLAVPVGDDDRSTRGVLLGTEEWLTALAYQDGAWRVVERYDLTERERIDALQAGEAAVETILSGG
jgi:hypothetical protein